MFELPSIAYLNLIKKYVKNLKDFFNVAIPSEDTEIGGCKSNPKKSYTTKVREDIPRGLSMFAISSFKGIENKHDVYRDEGYKK